MRLKTLAKYISLGLLVSTLVTSLPLQNINIGVLAVDAADATDGQGYSGSFNTNVTAACPGFYNVDRYVDAVDGDDCRDGTRHKDTCEPDTTTGRCPRGNGGGQKIGSWVYKRHICWDDDHCAYADSESCANRYGWIETSCDVCGSTSQSTSPSAYCHSSSDGKHHWNHAGSNGLAACNNCGRGADYWIGKCNRTKTFNVKGNWDNVVIYKMDNVDNTKVCTAEDHRVTIDYNSNATIRYKIKDISKATRINAYTWYKDGSPIKSVSYSSSYSFTTIDLNLSNVVESGHYYQLEFNVYGMGKIKTSPIYIDTTIVYFDYSPLDNVEGNETAYNLGTLIDRSRTPNTSIKAYKALIPDEPYGDLPGDESSEYNDIDSDGDAVIANTSLYMYHTIGLNPRGKSNGNDIDNYQVVLPGDPEYNDVDVYYNGEVLDTSGRKAFLGNVYDFNNADTSKIHVSASAKGSTELNTTDSRWSYNIYSFHKFLGWFLDKSFDEATRITPDTIVTIKGKHWAYANYNFNSPTDVQLPIPKREFTIKLDSEGGEVIDDSMTLDDIKYYFTFLGWGTSPDDNSITSDMENKPAYPHKHIGNTVDGGECYQTKVYHKHTGSEITGGGCYTQPIPHVHWGDPLLGTGCYTVPVYHICEGNEETGGACFSPVYHKHYDANGVIRDKGYIASTSGGCFTTEHRHYCSGSSSSGGGCYTQPVYHYHSSGCYETRKCGWKESDDGYPPSRCPGCGGGIWYHMDGNDVDGDTDDHYTAWCQGDNDGTFLKCNYNNGQLIGYSKTCGHNSGDLVGYSLSCPLTETSIICYKKTCGKEGLIESYTLGCDESKVDGYELGCGMTEETILGYKLSCEIPEGITYESVMSDNFISTSEILDFGDNFVPESDLDLYAHWSESAKTVKLPQVYKPGYVFLGWYTVPQSHIYPDVPTGGQDGTNAVYGNTFDAYYYNGFYAGAGYDPTKEGEEGYAKDCTFIEEVVNMDNYTNSTTLYAWFNRKPMFADVYEGLFLEGQAVSLKDLTRLVAAFDYEDDYYNEAIQKIYNLPEVDLDDIYLPVIVETDDDYEETEEDNEDDTDMSASNPDDDSFVSEPLPEGWKYGDEKFFDYSRWELVTSIGETTEDHEDGESVLDGDTDYGLEEDADDVNKSDTGSIVQASEPLKLDIVDSKIIIPETVTAVRNDGTTHEYIAGETVDGVYRCIEEGDNYGKLFFTVEAKECLEAFIKGTSLELRIKEITYHVTDGEASDETIDFTEIPVAEYDDSFEVTEVIPTTETLSDGTVVKSDTWKTVTYERPKWGLDTSTTRIDKSARTAEGLSDTKNWYGDFDITYQVTDCGILCGNSILVDAMSGTGEEGVDSETFENGIPNSAITMEYTRKCRIQYNDAPLVYMANYTLLNNFELPVQKFKDQVIANQVAIDAQDNMTNVPWWTKTKSLKELNESIEIVGVFDIEVNAGIAKELDMSATELSDYLESDIKTVEDLYRYKDADPASDMGKMYRSIISFNVRVNAHDQFGKYAGGSVTPTRQTLTLKAGEDGLKDFHGDLIINLDEYEPVDVSDPRACKYNVTDTSVGLDTEPTPVPPEDEIVDVTVITPPDFRESTIYLIDIFSDDDMTSANVHEEIRFISSRYMDLLKSSESYFGSAGYGLEKLEGVLAARESGSVKATTSTTYTTGIGNTVNVTVNDYTD